MDGPQAVRLSFFGAGNDVVVAWNTVAQQESAVQYGTSASALSLSATGTSGNYSEGTFEHSVALRGLKASTQYFYRCGSDAAGWSHVFSFNTLVSDGTEAPLTISVYGDMGISNSEATVANLVNTKSDYDFILHVGDFSYADDRLDTAKEFEETWNQWQQLVEPLSASLPYMVCPGNHEASCHSFGDFFCPPSTLNFTAYNHRFKMPALPSGGTQNMWYSFNVGMAHFIMLDTETDMGEHSPEENSLWKSGGFGDQLKWLQADLAAAVANRKTHPWIIVSGHRPMYTSSKSGTDNLIWPNATGHLRDAIESQLHAADVDYYLCGHVHAQERMYPVYRNVTLGKSYDNPASLVHLVVGSAGNVEGVSGWAPGTPDWLAFRSRDYGTGKLTLHNSTHSTWSYIRAADGAVLDTINVVKSRA